MMKREELEPVPAEVLFSLSVYLDEPPAEPAESMFDSVMDELSLAPDEPAARDI